MKKLLFGFMICLSSLANAGTEYIDNGNNRFSVDEYPRIKIWKYGNHTISKEGFILVCDYPRDFNSNTCFLPESKTIKSDTVNGWQIMQNYKIPGHIVKAYEIRSNGDLIVYFKPISTK